MPGSRVHAEDIGAFVRRDWAAVAEAKTGVCGDRKLGMMPDVALPIAGTLRQHAPSLPLVWSDSREREPEEEPERGR
jgi:hypothetical protein